MNISGEKLKKLRESKMYSVADVHKLCGVSEGAIRLIEAGKTKTPRLSIIQKLAEAFDLSSEDLVKAIAAESQPTAK